MTEHHLTPDEFRRHVAENTEGPPQKFTRTDTLGKEWDFSDIVPSLTAIFDLLTALAATKLELLPPGKLAEVFPITQGLHRLLEDVNKFTSVATEEEPDPKRRREKILGRADSLSAQAFKLFSPWISYLTARGTDRDRIDQIRKQTAAQSKVILDAARQGSEAVRSEGEHLLKEVTNILETARAASADVGVSKHSVHFQDEVREHTKSATFWLNTTTVLASGALLLSGLSLWHSICTSVSFPDSIPVTVAKLAILAIVYYGVIWSARMYRSERHNAVVNQHRHNALRSFETFVAASGDETTKNAVLLRATESIFSHQPSGFSDKAQESGEPQGPGGLSQPLRRDPGIGKTRCFRESSLAIVVGLTGLHAVNERTVIDRTK